MSARLLDGDFKDFENLQFPGRIVEIDARILDDWRDHQPHDLACNRRVLRRISIGALPRLFSPNVGHVIPIFPHVVELPMPGFPGVYDPSGTAGFERAFSFLKACT